ncbi:MAG: flagellar hook-basal body complex protein, partial [Holophagaceae bacterium]
MSLYSAFYSGLSGLSTNSNALNVIGNNLSNINTVGFKGSDMTFRDIFSTAGASATQGNGNPIQFGLGVQMNSVNQNFSQSSFQSTGNALDMAIQGNGFFTLQTAAGTQVFSRAGNFTRNSDGYLVASDGANVMGWNRTVTNGVGSVVTTGAAVPIQVSAATAGAQATANVGLSVNLNASAALNSTYSSPIQVYDSLGKVQNMVIDYTKTAEAQSPTTSLGFSGVNLSSAAGAADVTQTGFVYDSQGVQHNLT